MDTSLVFLMLLEIASGMHFNTVLGAQLYDLYYFVGSITSLCECDMHWRYCIINCTSPYKTLVIEK
jgi:hypothetical protein